MKKSEDSVKKSRKGAIEDGEYPLLNLLIFFLGEREIYRRIIFSHNEIFCSPDCETKREGDRIRTIKTQGGIYDIEPIVKQLPRSQKPDLVIVKADATRRNFPINLEKLNCPKLLICGNTQHLKAPIQILVEYALKEQFDFIMSDHKRHHLHFFKEAGFEKVFWIPGFNVNPHPQAPRLNPKYPLTFVGQVGRFHPYRRYIIEQVKKFDLPLNQLVAPQVKAAEIYAESSINLNVSMNGDLNLRVFEVLSSGGFLLSDRLSKQAGLDLLFEKGKHLDVFGNESELRYKLAFYLQNPEAAREIAQNGREQFWHDHRPELNIKRVLAYVGGEKIDDIYDLEKDRRTVYVSSDNVEELTDRISIYEYFQELHLNQPKLRGLFWPKVDPRMISDGVDLPRLDIHLIWDSKEGAVATSNLLARCEISEQITFQSYPTAKSKDQWDLIALTLTELQTIGVDVLLSNLNFQRLVITDGYGNLGAEEQQAWDDRLERRGLVKDGDRPLVYHWQRKADWGKLLLSQQKLPDSVRVFEQALQDNPWDVTALLELGMLSLKLNNFREAERLLRRASSLDRRNPLALEQLAKVLITLDRQEEATEILEHLLSIQPQDKYLRSLIENCYYRYGLEQKASVRSIAKTAVKKILVINNLYPPQELGGYGRSIYDFANSLRERGHAIYVISSNAPYLGEIRTAEPDIDRDMLLLGSYEVGTKPIADPREISRILNHNDLLLRNIIERFSPDVCLIGNIDLIGPGIFAPFLEKKIPVINHLGFTTLRYPPGETPQSPLYLLAAASNYVKQNALAQGYPFEDIAVVYPGALVKQFEMCMLPNLDKLRIVYAGLLMESKGPQTLLEALKILDDMNVDFHCYLAGDSLAESFVNVLKNFVLAQGMEKKVKFLGYLQRSELIELYSSNNVMVFPSISEEAFGISPVEGMAAGLTILTTGVGGAGEVVEHEVSGLIFPPGNATALAEALMNLIEDRKRWEGLAAAGQKRAREIFDIERSVDVLEEKFDELLGIRDRDGEYLQQKLQGALRSNLRLRDVNLVIFPDWSAQEEFLGLELSQAIGAMATHPDKNQITLLIDRTGISSEDADAAISSVVMNLLMSEDLDVDDGPEMTIIGEMSEMQWSALLPLLNARIVLESERQPQAKLITPEALRSLRIEELADIRFSREA